jgi:hypothetical protein
LAWSLVLVLSIGPVAYAEDPAPGWQTYHSEIGGFSLSVPVDWVPSVQPGLDGPEVISLTAPDNLAGVMIVVQPTADASPADDLPNTRCQPITLGGQPATRCLDTLSFSSTIWVAVGDRLYQILASERRLGPDVYQTLLASFSFDQAVQSPSAVPQPAGSTTIAPPSPVYDCTFSTGPGRPKPLCPVP